MPIDPPKITRQTVKLRKQFPRQIDCAFSGHARTQEYRQKFRIRKVGGAVFQEFLTGTFRLGPV